jgi:acyl-CoA thioesterase-1
MPAPRIDRRTVLSLAAAAVAWPAMAAPAKPKIVTMLGDSITAGYGLARAQALPAQLHLALQKLGVPNVVRGSGISGDTTAGGLARLPFSIHKDTDLVIVALGGNDLLQGLDPKATGANLDKILDWVQARGMAVVLAGLAAPVEIGGGYARDFNAVFPKVAHEHGAVLYPNLLAGVGRNPALKQPDAIHPNAAGVKIIAARLAPVVAKALRSP